VVENPHDSDVVNLTNQKWRLCHQVEITLQTMAFWQRVLEGETYVTGSLVPLAIYTIRQSFLQVIASVESDPQGSVTANIEYLYIRNYGTDNDRIFEYTIFSRTLYSNLRGFLVILCRFVVIL